MENKPEPKFKVGDIIAKAHLRFRIVKIEDDRYIIEGMPGINLVVFFKDQDKYRLVKEEVKPNIIEEAKTYWDSIKDAWVCPEGYQFVDENGNVINATKIVLEKKKKEYPKTFLECCDVLGIENLIERGVKGYKAELFDTLQKLLIRRDAYWKIAGEEMGLGKPWEPTNGNGEKVYSIVRCCGTIKKNSICDFSNCYILEFPTEEMRDDFKENFDKDLEFCKEFL